MSTAIAEPQYEIIEPEAGTETDPTVIRNILAARVTVAHSTGDGGPFADIRWIIRVHDTVVFVSALYKRVLRGSIAYYQALDASHNEAIRWLMTWAYFGNVEAAAWLETHGYVPDHRSDEN